MPSGEKWRWTVVIGLVLVSLPAWPVLWFYGICCYDTYQASLPRPTNELYLGDFSGIENEPVMIALTLVSIAVIYAIAWAVYSLLRPQ